MTVKPSKPFNPILGETYEGYLHSSSQSSKLISKPDYDSSIFKVYVEQTSHHPPISNFLVENKIVRIYGHYELQGSTSTNSYNIKNQGPCTVHFKDTD